MGPGRNNVPHNRWIGGRSSSVSAHCLAAPVYAGCTMKGGVTSRIASSPMCANVVGAATQNASVVRSWEEPSREDELSHECMRTVVV